MEEEKKSGGFWKGFFTATIIFILIAVICITFVLKWDKFIVCFNF